MIKNDFNNCNPSILFTDTLITLEWVFMNKKSVKEKCDCINKNICLQIIDLLDNNKLNEAETLILSLNKHNDWK